MKVIVIHNENGNDLVAAVADSADLSGIKHTEVDREDAQKVITGKVPLQMQLQDILQSVMALFGFQVAPQEAPAPSEVK